MCDLEARERTPDTKVCPSAVTPGASVGRSRSGGTWARGCRQEPHVGLLPTHCAAHGGLAGVAGAHLPPQVEGWGAVQGLGPVSRPW